MPTRAQNFKRSSIKTDVVARRRYETMRPSSNERLYDYTWQKARKAYLSRHPLCVQCKSEGLIVAAGVVDHITPHKGDRVLFWDTNNWQSLCTHCHNVKTATEDGGYGRH